MRSLVKRLDEMLENPRTDAPARRRELLEILVKLYLGRGKSSRDSLQFDIVVPTLTGDWVTMGGKPPFAAVAKISGVAPKADLEIY